MLLFVCFRLCSFLIYFRPSWNGLLLFCSLNAFSKKGKKTTLLGQIYFVSSLVQFPPGYILPFLMFSPPVERIGTVLTFHNVFRSPSVFVILGLLKISQGTSHDIKIIVIMPAGWQAWVYEADSLLMTLLHALLICRCSF